MRHKIEMPRQKGVFLPAFYDFLVGKFSNEIYWAW